MAIGHLVANVIDLVLSDLGIRTSSMFESGRRGKHAVSYGGAVRSDGAVGSAADVRTRAEVDERGSWPKTISNGSVATWRCAEVA